MRFFRGNCRPLRQIRPETGEYLKYVLVISLIMFYDNRTAVVYKVIVSVIYSSVDHFLCINYLGIVQQKLSDLTYSNRFEKWSSIICLGLLFLELLRIWCHIMFFRTDSISINYFMLQCSCAIIFVKSIYYRWKSRWNFVNIPDAVLKQINASLLHDDVSILLCKSATTSIVTKLNKFLLQTMYTVILSLIGTMINMLKPSWTIFNILSNNVLKNFNIQTSSLNGFIIWKNMLICNSH